MTISYPNVIDCSNPKQLESLPKHIECDVLIAGSGAGGGVAAEIFTQFGLKVVIVEEGPLKTSADFNLREKDAYAELYQEVAGRQTKDKGIQILQGRAVGGSTTVNWTSSFRTPEQTRAFWQSQYGVKNVSNEQMAPWFNWAEKRLNIEPWAVPPNQNNQLLANGLKALGWSYQVIPRNVKGCANLGYCGMGCPINAKQSMLVTCIPNALSQGAQLISRARVESLIIKNGTAQGVSLSSMNKLGQLEHLNHIKVMAKHTVLSAGAIGTPAILLRSGLEKQIPAIGKRTFLHPVTATVAQMPQAVNGYEGAPQSIYSDQFLWRDGVSGELGYKLEVPPLHPLITSTILRTHGNEHFELMRNFAQTQANLALLRDGFHEDSAGGQVGLDKYNYPYLDYSISNTLWRGLKHAMLTMAEVQFAAGAKNVLPIHMDASLSGNWSQTKQMIKNLPAKIIRWQIVSAHVMGGCFMSEHNNDGVCNSDGLVKSLDGLSVMDGSLFPTSLGVNPQLSIYAMVAKLATTQAKKLTKEATYG